MPPFLIPEINYGKRYNLRFRSTDGVIKKGIPQFFAECLFFNFTNRQLNGCHIYGAGAFFTFLYIKSDLVTFF